MPSSNTRHRLEIPASLYDALALAAERENLGTSSLAGLWLHSQLKEHYPDLAGNSDPYRYENGPRARRSDAKTPRPGRQQPAPPTERQPSERERAYMDGKTIDDLLIGN